MVAQTGPSGKATNPLARALLEPSGSPSRRPSEGTNPEPGPRDGADLDEKRVSARVVEHMLPPHHARHLTGSSDWRRAKWVGCMALVLGLLAAWAGYVAMPTYFPPGVATLLEGAEPRGGENGTGGVGANPLARASLEPSGSPNRHPGVRRLRG